MPLIDFITKALHDEEEENCPSESPLEQIPQSIWGTIDKIMAIRLKSDPISEAISSTVPPYTHPPAAKEHDLRKFLEMINLELKFDSDYMQPFNNPPSIGAEILESFRPFIVQWMMHMHQWMGIPTRALHTAVGLMDLCTQLQPIACQDYQTLAIAALITATLQWRPIFKFDFVKLSELTLNEMEPQQIERMMTLMRSWIGSRVNFPIPHDFLDIFIFGLIDFTYDAMEWTRKVCNYIFDLGLQDERLCYYSASLRCAAVLYLIRYILKKKCSCPRSKTGRVKGSRYRDIPLWSEALEKFTSHHDTVVLRRVSAIYLNALMLTQQYGVQFYRRHHLGSPNSVVFNKYMRPEYKRIAMDPRLRNFTNLDKINFESS